jgi:hypothetical protein
MTGRVVSVVLVAVLALVGGRASIARAQSSSTIVKEASKHFQRGVALYGETDYRAALVEFRKAYELSPNPTVLYNIGQTYYQLQNYAAALVALGRYLTEAGAGAAHRREVEQTIDTLQTRVGKVAISSSAPGCDITIDDELVGKTPLEEPVLVSIGRRKITALRDGRVAETRFVDVAAGDTVNVTLSGVEAARATQAAAGAADTGPSGRTVMIGWVSTAVLGAAAIGTGAVAFFASRDLSDAREHGFPVTASELSNKGSKVKTYALAADILGVATLVAGAISVKLTLSQSSSHEAHVAIMPNGLQLAGKF